VAVPTCVTSFWALAVRVWATLLVVRLVQLPRASKLHVCAIGGTVALPVRLRLWSWFSAS
jgi:hypothetical protein